MDIRFLAENEAASTLLTLIKGCDRMAFAVAWAGRNAVASNLLKHSRKIANGVIGTHLYQTSPDLLRDFLPVHRARYMPPSGRLFHPKTYLFWIDGGVTAIVGSHNLTASAFEARNIEASVLIQGAASEKVFGDLKAFIERSWKLAKPIENDDFLFSYDLQYRANKNKREELEAFRLVRRSSAPRFPSPLVLTWASFVRGIKDDRHHSAEGRLSILERARRLFLDKGAFEKMDRAERRAVAGTFGTKEPQLDGHDWGWFGTMFGQGDFKNLVNESPVGLSRALDRIPIRGDVTERQYSYFVEHFLDAFQGRAHKGGVATASRLLALKRPDWFLAVNNANREALCASLGAAPSTLGLKNYWHLIAVPIVMSVWWNHPRPTSTLESRIWDNRAALLDSHFYVPI